MLAWIQAIFSWFRYKLQFLISDEADFGVNNITLNTQLVESFLVVCESLPTSSSNYVTGPQQMVDSQQYHTAVQTSQNQSISPRMASPMINSPQLPSPMSNSPGQMSHVKMASHLTSPIMVASPSSHQVMVSGRMSSPAQPASRQSPVVLPARSSAQVFANLPTNVTLNSVQPRPTTLSPSYQVLIFGSPKDLI